MLFVAFAGEGEHAPDFGIAAGLRKDFSLVAGDGRGCVHHFLAVVHDPVGAVLRKDHQVQARQAQLHALDHLSDLVGVLQDLGLGVQARHLVVDDGDTDGVVTAGNIAVKHVGLLKVGTPKQFEITLAWVPIRSLT